MKKFLLIGILLVATLWLASCTDWDAPLTETQQAEKYNMTIGEYKEMKDAAARMNMTIEEHMKMTDTGDMWWMDHSSMDMWDDSSMIEDDSDGMHKMDDWTMMDDDTMHMETMHVWDDIEKHGDDKHWEHE